MSLTSLPIVGATDENPFVLSSALLPVNAKSLGDARVGAATAGVKQAEALGRIHPVLHTGEWTQWLQRRQALRRAHLLREAGLPEISSNLFI